MAVNEVTLIPVQTQTQIVPVRRAKTEVQMPRAYIETPDIDLTSMDVLRQFQANMSTLEDLNGRLRFMMGEIRGLVRR